MEEGEDEEEKAEEEDDYFEVEEAKGLEEEAPKSEAGPGGAEQEEAGEEKGEAGEEKVEEFFDGEDLPRERENAVLFDPLGDPEEGPEGGCLGPWGYRLVGFSSPCRVVVVVNSPSGLRQRSPRL